MARSARSPELESALPTAPTAEVWASMSESERERFVLDAMAALQTHQEAMSEGSPHFRAKVSARQILSDWFARMGRKIYLGCELAVHYPGEPVFAPDLIAVLDVEDPGDEDTRMAWVVAQEGRGLDLVLEVVHQGDRQKDLADNVLTYARLGIPEYFIYDRLRQRALGYRLPFVGAGRYQPVAPRGGVLESKVLGLELGVFAGALRFFHNGAELPETRDLLARVTALVDDLERRAVEAERRAAEEAEARAELERRLAELMAGRG